MIVRRPHARHFQADGYAGVLRRSRLLGSRKGWRWESRVSEALDLRTRGTGASRTSGMRVSTQMWYSLVKVVFGASVLLALQRAAAVAAASSSLGVGRRSRQSLLRSRLPTTPTLVLRNSWPGPSPLIGAATQLYTFAGVSAPSGSPARLSQLSYHSVAATVSFVRRNKSRRLWSSAVR